MEQNAESREHEIERIRRALPDGDTLYDLANLFKMFGDPTRAKILSCLQIRDLYVGELAEVLGQIFPRRRPRHQDHGIRPHTRQRGALTGIRNTYALFGIIYLNNCSIIQLSAGARPKNPAERGG